MKDLRIQSVSRRKWKRMSRKKENLFGKVSKMCYEYKPKVGLIYENYLGSRLKD